MEGSAAPLKRPRWPALVWIALALLVVAAGALVTYASYDMARRLVHHRGVRPSVTPADSGLTYETVPFAATDGTRLEGWWIVPRDGVRRSDLATVILCHPEDDSFAVATGMSGKARVLPLATALARAGFIVLAFDFRSYGGSEGGITTGGWLERKDLAGAIQFAGARSLGAPLILYGRGMGATVAMLLGAVPAGMARPGNPGVTVQVVAEAPRANWNQSILDRVLVQRGPLTHVALPVVTRGFVARELLGDFDGDAGQIGSMSWAVRDSAVSILSSRGVNDCSRVTGLVERRLSALAAAATRAAAHARADSLDQARGRVDSLRFIGDHGLPL